MSQPDILKKPSQPETGALNFAPKGNALIPKSLMLSAVVIILAMLVIIVGDVLIGGLGTMSWTFLSKAP